MIKKPTHVVNVDEVDEVEHLAGEYWGAAFKALTPTMRPKGGSLGVNQMRLPPGRTLCPFHYHQLEDEVFFVLSGKGVLRYGDELQRIGPGDCISCPAGTRVAHQIVNCFDQDLVYLSIGRHDKNEVCVYPDSKKVLVRGIGKIGFLEEAEYLEGEPERPKIFDLVDAMRPSEGEA